MEEVVRLVHGNGGQYSAELMANYIMPYFKNDLLATLHDGAQFEVPQGRMAFSTDSYVVTPAFFPGGNIGKIAVCGTVNDITMNGGIPKYLSCSFIIEDGYPINNLIEITKTMGETAAAAGVQIVTGDTKVVEKGAVDGIYINTAGVGMIPEDVHINANRVKAGMDIILTGTLGDHAVAIMGSRFGITLPESIKSDCAALNYMIHAALKKFPDDIALLRDPTRGGLATALAEIAKQTNLGLLVEEECIPVREDVQALCSMLGYDPLYLANEEKAILFVDPSKTEEIIFILQNFEEGKDARRIGTTFDKNHGKVALKTALGGMRLLDALRDDQLPRIC